MSVSEGASSVEVIITASSATFVELYLEDGTAQGEQQKWCRMMVTHLTPFLLTFFSLYISHYTHLSHLSWAGLLLYHTVN